MSTATKAGKRQIVVFTAAGERFAADIFAVERVLRYSPPRVLPSAERWLRGVIEHGGTAIPVVDLRERLGLPAQEPGDDSRVLIVQVGEVRVGVTVDAVQAVRTVDASAVEPPPAIYRGLAREYLEGVVRDGGEILVLLDTKHLLTSTERIAMERMMASGGLNA
jgi:purine-binding chemotaxis protein CheW